MAKLAKGRQLSVLQEKFVAEYLIEPNGTRAYQRAKGGKVSYFTAHRESQYLLANPTVRAHIKAGMTAVSRSAKLKAKKVVQGLMRVAFTDPLDFFDREGNPLPLHEVPIKSRMAIKKIKAKVISKKIETFKEEGSDEEQHIEKTVELVEIEIADKTGALDKLMKHTGQYLADNKQKRGKLTESEAEAIKERLKMRGFDIDKVTARSAN